MRISIFIIFFCICQILATSAWAQDCRSLEYGKTYGCARQTDQDRACQSGLFAFYPNSCISNDQDTAVSDLLKVLAEGDIPATIYEKYSSKEIARAIVYKRYLEKTKALDLEKFKTPDFDLFADTSIQMAFNQELLPLISQTGFKNKFQTRRDPHFPNLVGRYNEENRLAGQIQIEPTISDKESPVHFVRPKYAYLVPLKTDGIFASATYSWVYGNIIAVFKNEVKTRSTYTPTDSLLGKLTSEVFNNPAPPLMTTTSRYYEAQIWGELTLDDVDYFMIGCPGLKRTYINKFLEAFKATQKNGRIFECTVDSVTRAYKPGRLLQEFNRAFGQMENSDR